MENTRNELVEILDEVMEKSNKNLLSNLSELVNFITDKEMESKENIICLTIDEITEIKHSLTEAIIVLSYNLRKQLLKDVEEIFEEIIIPTSHIEMEDEWVSSKPAYGFFIDEKDYSGRFYISKDTTDELVEVMGISTKQFFDMILKQNVKKIDDDSVEFQHKIEIVGLGMHLDLAILP